MAGLRPKRTVGAVLDARRKVATAKSIERIPKPTRTDMTSGKSGRSEKRPSHLYRKFNPRPHADKARLPSTALGGKEQWAHGVWS